MKLVLLVAALCAVALAADMKDAVKTMEKAAVAKTMEKADKMEKVDKVEKVDEDKEEMEKLDEIVKLPGTNKTWAESVLSIGVAPNAFVFSANLPMYAPTKLKQEVASSFSLQAELDHWNKTGNPDTLTFTGDDGQATYALMSSVQPVIFTGYNKDIKFHLFTKADKNDIYGYVIDDPKKIHESPYNPKLPLKVIVHGFTNTIRSPVIQKLKNAFLETGEYNVIGMDWGKLCPAPWYQTARAHVVGAGAKLGEFLDDLLEQNVTDVSQIHLIGHSLGAHVVGISSKQMHRGKPVRITGLDPAGPLFELTSKHGILWKDDADLVDVIHTNAGFLGLGKSKHLGHVDFYPNGGRLQPGCTFDVTGSCSHGRVYDLYEFTIRNPDVLLDAYLCKTLPGGADQCEKHIRNHELETKALMGYNVKFEMPGTYFLKTTDHPDWKYSNYF